MMKTYPLHPSVHEIEGDREDVGLVLALEIRQFRASIRGTTFAFDVLIADPYEHSIAVYLNGRSTHVDANGSYQQVSREKERMER